MCKRGVAAMRDRILSLLDFRIGILDRDLAHLCARSRQDTGNLEETPKAPWHYPRQRHPFDLRRNGHGGLPQDRRLNLFEGHLDRKLAAMLGID